MKKIYRYCLRCGRKLTSQENMERGMGRTCYLKSQINHKQRSLFDIKKEDRENDNRQSSRVD